MLKATENQENDVRVGLARNAARKLLKQACVKEAPVLINTINPILREKYALLIASRKLDDHMSGFLLQDEEVCGIAYNANHHVHRQRMTVAHEIGHLVLDHNYISGFKEYPDNYEKEAKIFASELLIPLPFLKNDFKTGLCDATELAKRYWVSKEAMGWRLQDQYVLRHIV
jgi:Zn-dependent peptidase ImmA (M78 family)